MNDTFHSSSMAMANIDGDKVRRLREIKGLTQLYVATVVGVTTDTISRWENRRYPSIKQENALKLAEALEVPLSEILEDKKLESQKTANNNHSKKQEAENEIHSGRKRIIQRLVLPVFILLVLLATLWWFYAQQHTASISAYRVLPSHTPAGQIFPVVIHVETREAESFSLILKEFLPEGFIPVRSAPSFTSIDEKKGVLKWISRGGGRGATFAYIARTATDSGEEEKYHFAGTVTLRNAGNSTADILGPNAIMSSNFHWADANRDGRIDDEEILTVYDTFSALDELDFDWEQIDDIWSGQGYLWDATSRNYVIIP